MGNIPSAPPPPGSPPGTQPVALPSFTCPTEFIMAPGSGMACMIKCPEQKNYKLSSNGAMLSCSYIGDPTITVQLNTVPAYIGQPASYTTLPNKDVYRTELERFARDLAVTDANIDKAFKVKTAYDKLQMAENARDQSPDAYDRARVAYYTLVKGDKWIDEERQRIANVEAQPVVNTLIAKRNDLDSQIGQQQSTIDIVNGVKDKVLSVEDDLQYSVSAFEKQIENVRNQINMDKKKQIVTAKQAGSWVNSLLNWLIALTTLIAIVFIVRYIIRRRSAFSTPASPPVQR
jgi:hypothetical protein